MKSLTYPVLLVLAYLLFSCNGSSKQKNEPTNNSSETTQVSPAETKKDTDTVADTLTQPKPDTSATEEEDNTSDPGPGATNTDETTPSAPTPAPKKSSGKLATRTVDEERLGIIIDLIAQELEDQNLAYDHSLGQDCSGIFHKIKDLVQKKMSELGDQEKYHYPTFAADRNSRQIADWYHRNNNLHIVQNANADRNLITPGTVLFFGRTEEKYNNITIDKLTNPGKFVHDGNNGKIFHVAVVTKVERDDAGNVIQYDMMHGRNSKYTASRTTANYDGPGSYAKKHAQFPFGNWNQQLVALAHIETPK